jgi:hypothetical protein
MNSIAEHLKETSAVPSLGDTTTGSDLDLGDDQEAAVLLEASRNPIRSSHRPPPARVSDYYDDNDATDDLEQPLVQQQVERDDIEEIEIDFATGLTRDRQTRIHRVAEDATIMHSMIQGVYDLVVQQGELFDTIEEHVLSVRQDAVEAGESVIKADEYMQAKRRRMCCLLVCMLIGILVVLLFVSLLFR